MVRYISCDATIDALEVAADLVIEDIFSRSPDLPKAKRFWSPGLRNQEYERLEEQLRRRRRGEEAASMASRVKKVNYLRQPGPIAGPAPLAPHYLSGL